MSDSEAPAVTAQTVLDPPSTVEAPTAEVQVEEEEVAYDEEPDEEQQADGHALPRSEDAHNEVLQQVAFPSLSGTAWTRKLKCTTSACSAARVLTALQVQDATETAAAAAKVAPKGEKMESEEWELSTIPDEWKPAPLFKVRTLDSIQHYMSCDYEIASAVAAYYVYCKYRSKIFLQLTRLMRTLCVRSWKQLIYKSGALLLTLSKF